MEEEKRKSFIQPTYLWKLRKLHHGLQPAVFHLVYLHIIQIYCIILLIILCHTSTVILHPCEHLEMHKNIKFCIMNEINNKQNLVWEHEHVHVLNGLSWGRLRCTVAYMCRCPTSPAEASPGQLRVTGWQTEWNQGSQGLRENVCSHGLNVASKRTHPFLAYIQLTPIVMWWSENGSKAWDFSFDLQTG